jgi:hypothetical protein
MPNATATTAAAKRNGCEGLELIWSPDKKEVRCPGVIRGTSLIFNAELYS